MTENEFLELCNKVIPRVKRYLKPVITLADDREDIVQDTILLAWKNIQQYDPARSTFATWFVTIYHNVLNRHLRHEYEKGNTSDTISINELVEANHMETANDDLVAMPVFDDKIALEQALTQLGGIHEEVIRECFIGGLTFQEVSDETGISHRNVRRIVATGLKRLRKIMEVKRGSEESK